jgi:hypothetical protein
VKSATVFKIEYMRVHLLYYVRLMLLGSLSSRLLSYPSGFTTFINEMDVLLLDITQNFTVHVQIRNPDTAQVAVGSGLDIV